MRYLIYITARFDYSAAEEKLKILISVLYIRAAYLLFVFTNPIIHSLPFKFRFSTFSFGKLSIFLAKIKEFVNSPYIPTILFNEPFKALKNKSHYSELNSILFILNSELQSSNDSKRIYKLVLASNY